MVVLSRTQLKTLLVKVAEEAKANMPNSDAVFDAVQPRPLTWPQVGGWWSADGSVGLYANRVQGVTRSVSSRLVFTQRTRHELDRLRTFFGNRGTLTPHYMTGQPRQARYIRHWSLEINKREDQIWVTWRMFPYLDQIRIPQVLELWRYFDRLDKYKQAIVGVPRNSQRFQRLRQDFETARDGFIQHMADLKGMTDLHIPWLGWAMKRRLGLAGDAA